MSLPPHTEERVHPHQVQVFLKKRRTDLAVGFILALLCLGIVAWMAVHLVTTDQVDARHAGLAIPVEVLSAGVHPLRMTIGASGTVSALNTISITARVISPVTKVPVDLGDVVRAGDLLAQLDDRVFAAGVESARATADHAEKQLARMETLEQRGYGAASDTELARTAAAAAEQVLVQSRIDLGNTRILAPVASVILTRSVNPGEVTNGAQEVFQLGPIDQVYMVADVPTDKTGFVATGMQAEVTIDSFPGEIFQGQVAKIDAVASVATRTFCAYIRIENPGLRLRPGVTGYARLERSHSALAVPGVAILNPVGDKATLFVVDGQDRAHIREVRPGLMADGMTEILDGLQEGEKVVTVGQLELHEGDRVTINHAGLWNR